MVDEVEGKDPERMMDNEREVPEGEEDARADDGGDEREDGEIPEMAGIEGADACGALGEEEGKEKTERGNGAVRGDDKGAEMEEDGKHLKVGYRPGRVGR